jgi:glycerophosphoryl diester phosphodiesterase
VLAAERDAIVLIELKGSPLVFADLTKAALAAVERTRTRERVAFLSFCHSALADLHDLAPEIPRAPLFDRTPALEAVLFCRSPLAVFEAGVLTESLAEGLRATGVATAAYGVDDLATDARLDALGVGLRISDRPDLLAARRQKN